MSARLRSQVIRAFKMHGLSLRSESSDYLASVLEPVNEVEREDWIDRIIDAVQKQPLDSNILDANTIEAAIQDCNSEETGSEEILSIYDAFSIPKYEYVTESKKFVKENSTDVSLFSDAEGKANLFLSRYNLLHQRTIRHKLFTPPIKGIEDVTNTKKFNLKTIEYLLSCSNKVKDIIVLGMLSQIKEKKHHLEDPTGLVELDLSQTKYHAGLFTENSFVLAEGWYDDMVFHVTALGFPPPESSHTTRAYYGNINFFGGNAAKSNKSNTKLIKLEKDSTSKFMVFASDIWLDKTATLDKLNKMFAGFSEIPPICFVFCGTFCSTPYGFDHSSKVKNGFKKLAEIIIQYPSIVNFSKFIFVPSNEDIIQSKILPRPSLPENITSTFVHKIKNAVFTTNPCRIQYYTHEIVVLRTDLTQKMVKNSIQCPNENVTTHLAKTLIAQAHLSPLPLHINPIYWKLDQAMRLYPPPDLCVIADKTCAPFHEELDLQCKFLNPGPFSTRNFSFSVYCPANGVFEESNVPDD